MRLTQLTVIIFALVLALCAFGQTSTTSTSTVVPNVILPAYIFVGGAFNQYSVPRGNAVFAGIVPVSNQVGIYESTAADIIPVKTTDPATRRTVYVFQSTLREGVHKVVYNSRKLMLLVGGDGGVSFTQSPATGGTNVSGAGSITGTAVYQLSAHWAIGVPVRALWTGQGGWNLVPEAGVVWKP